LAQEVSWLGASIPAFLAGFILYAVLGPIAQCSDSREAAARGERQETVSVP